MNELTWGEDGRFNVGGLPFKSETVDYSVTTDAKRIVLLKERALVEYYREFLAREAPSQMLEVGTFECGSVLLFAALLPELKITGIDLRDECKAAVEWARRFGDRVKLRYNITQDDEQAIRRVVASDFAGQLDLICDDASHWYAPTRRCFEICFPLLRSGGKYVIEDWGWGHWNGWPQETWRDQPLLSNFGHELIAAAAAHPDLIAYVEVNRFAFIVTRGSAQVSTLNMDELWRPKDRPLVLV
jgi:SAM-dependent methyltransferase